MTNSKVFPNSVGCFTSMNASFLSVFSTFVYHSILSRKHVNFEHVYNCTYYLSADATYYLSAHIIYLSGALQNCNPFHASLIFFLPFKFWFWMFPRPKLFQAQGVFALKILKMLCPQLQYFSPKKDTSMAINNVSFHSLVQVCSKRISLGVLKDRYSCRLYQFHTARQNFNQNLTLVFCFDVFVSVDGIALF